MWFPSVSEWLIQTRWVKGRKWAEPGWNQERMSGSECKTAVDLVLWNEPLLAHAAGGLWGTGDKGPIKGRVLPFWTEFWTQVPPELRYIEARYWNQWGCTDIPQPRPRPWRFSLFPALKNFLAQVCLFPFFPAPAPVQGSSKPQGDVQSTFGSFCLSVAPAQTAALCHPFDPAPRAAVLPGWVLPAHSHYYFILQLAHWITHCLVPQAVPVPRSLWFKQGRKAKVMLQFPFCNLGTEKNTLPLFTQRPNQTPSASMP